MLNIPKISTKPLYNPFIERKTTDVKAQNKEFEFPSYKFYPQISFTGTTSMQAKVQEMGKENLPNEKIWDIAMSREVKAGGMNLFDVHTKFYAPLKECKTLNEAKEKFPEFASVIDAKDMDEADMTYSMRQIKNGEIEGITIEELSLDMLKKVYADVLSFKEKDNYYGFTSRTSMSMADRLNIPRMKKPYDQYLKRCTPKKCSTMAKVRKQYIEEHPEEEEQRRQKILQYYQEHPEVRQEKSDRMKEYYEKHPEALDRLRESAIEYFAEHPEKREEITEILSNWSKNNPELELLRQEKISKSMKAFYQEHPEYIEAQKQAWDNLSHYKDSMRIVAQSFPRLGEILAKADKGEPLTEYETRYRAQYFQACINVAPDMFADIGKEHSRLINELKSQNN